MNATFYSHGKVLLTGEYLVVDGAEGLALPCKYGQRMDVVLRSDSSPLIIHWKSFTSAEELWFEGRFQWDGTSLVIEVASDDQIAIRLQRWLTWALKRTQQLNNGHWEVQTHLEFPRDWGLGSSSTTLANIAQWLDVNVYELFHATEKGSGYDLACATADGPLMYKKELPEPRSTRVEWLPSFHEHLYFVHMGQKQRSDVEVKKYQDLAFDRAESILKVNSMTHRILRAKDLSEFKRTLEEHEALLAEILRRPTIKSQLFSDFPGLVKSLGAWGGDFILVSSDTHPRTYFQQKGFPTIIPYAKMVL